MKTKTFKQYGKDGAKKRWQAYTIERHRLIVELSKYIDKPTQNMILAKAWPNKEIAKLINEYQTTKK